VWLDRGWAPAGAAAVRIDRLEGLAAIALAESLAVEKGRPRHLRAHLDRLAEGCSALGWPGPDRAALERAARAVPAKNRLERGGLRLRWWGGLSRPLLLAWALPAPAETLGAPLRIMTSAVRHYGPDSLNARAKVAQMLPNWLAKAETEAWAEDGLRLGPEGLVAEGVWTNIVAVKRGVARTPPLAQGILEGVTRALFLERLGRSLGLRVRQEPLTRYDLWTAERAWVTSSLRGALEVASVDGRILGA